MSHGSNLQDTNTPHPGGPGVEIGPPPPLQRLLAALALSARAFLPPLRPIDWLLPLLIVVGFAMAGGALVRDLAVTMAQERAVEQIERNDRLDAAAKEEAIAQLEEGPTRRIIEVSSVVAPVVMIPLACLLATLALWLIVAFIMGMEASFAKIWPVASLAWSPYAIRAILHALLARAQGRIDIHFGPAALVPEDGLLRSILSPLDLFDIWMLAIQIVGLSVVLNLARAKARAAVLAMWIFYWALAMGVAALQAKLGGGA